MTRGFVTIATGRECYVKQAMNLLLSYSLHTEHRLPFAIITDLDVPKGLFDEVIKVDTLPSSYMSKLYLDSFLLFDETIFIDADCLAFGDLNRLFELFEPQGDFCCFGRVLPLDDRTGWFSYENTGIWKSKVEYVLGLHSGVLYMKKGEMCTNIFNMSRLLEKEYDSFKFAETAKPADEPLFALSMAIYHLKPIQQTYDFIICDWEHPLSVHSNIIQKRYTIDGTHHYPLLVHWGGGCLKWLAYKKQIALLNLKKGQKLQILITSFLFDIRIWQHNFILAIKRGILSIINSIW